MLRNLSQLITTILAIGVSFYAAYLIYLFSMKSSITSKVEEEGYIVLNILEKHTKPLFYTFTGIGNRALISYMIQYPEFSRLDLLDKMLNDAEEMISDPSKKGNISLLLEDCLFLH